jgi:hypothetical protein
VPVPDENAFPYGRFRSRNIKNDYVAERHVIDRREDQVNLYIRFVGTFEAKCLPLKQPFCKSKGLMKMKATTTTNLKVKMEVTYIKVIIVSENFHMLQSITRWM